MTNQILLGLFDLGIAIVLYITVARARRDKRLKITLISDPITTVRSVLLTGRSITIATIGLGISAVILTLSGLSSLLQLQTLESTLFLSLISIFIIVITMIIASYFTFNSKEREDIE